MVKKNLVLSIDENLRDTAKEMGLNLSGFPQSKLLEFIKNNKNGTLTETQNNALSHWRDLNPRPADYESAALPPELQWHSMDQVY